MNLSERTFRWNKFYENILPMLPRLFVLHILAHESFIVNRSKPSKCDKKSSRLRIIVFIATLFHSCFCKKKRFFNYASTSFAFSDPTFPLGARNTDLFRRLPRRLHQSTVITRSDHRGGGEIWPPHLEIPGTIKKKKKNNSPDLQIK